MITIREANMEDLPLLHNFEQGVIVAERPFDPFLKESQITYYDITDLIQSEQSVIFIAESNSKMVGSGYAQIRQSKAYWKEVQFAYLGFMFVEPAFRGQGINQKIMEHLKQWALSRKIYELRLDVYENNEAAIRAYQKTGFKKHMIEMRLNLEDD